MTETLKDASQEVKNFFNYEELLNFIQGNSDKNKDIKTLNDVPP